MSSKSTYSECKFFYKNKPDDITKFIEDGNSILANHIKEILSKDKIIKLQLDNFVYTKLELETIVGIINSMGYDTGISENRILTILYD